MKKVLLMLIGIIVAAYNINAQKWVEVGKELPEPDINFIEYGASMAIDGDYAVVGAPGYFNNQGCAYVLYYDGWEWREVARLTALDWTTEKRLGESVSISGDVIAVGAPYDDVNGDSSGSVYVFKKPVTGWVNVTQVAKLTPSSGSSYDEFGKSVSISGDVIVSGAPNKGSAYVFVMPGGGWANMTQTAILESSDGVALDNLGCAVGISGDVIVVGAKNFTSMTHQGAAYVYVKPGGGWANMNQTAKLLSSDIANADEFGTSVAISGDTIAVGAPGDDSYGAIYVFVKPGGGWANATQNAKLTHDHTFPIGYSVCISNSVIGTVDNHYRADIFEKPSGGWSDITQTARVYTTLQLIGSVCISDNFLFTGYSKKHISSDLCGAISIYEKPLEGWVDTSLAEIYGPVSNCPDNSFGISVAMDGDYAVIGEYGYRHYKGRATVLHYDGSEWERVGILTASDGETGDYFGFSVAIKNNTVVVGSYKDGGIGSAYIFEKPPAGWNSFMNNEIAKITSSDGVTDDMFGYSVDITDSVVVVSSYWDDDKGAQSGSAYIFKEPVTGWVSATQTAKLTASDGAANDWFGQSVSIFRNTVVAGSRMDDDNGNNSGSAYVFVKPSGGWVNMTQTAKLTASDGAAADYFGTVVDIYDSTIVIGASWDDDMASNSGSVYVFEKPSGGWANVTQTAKLTASDAGADDYLGYSITISDTVIVAGVSNDDDLGTDAGSIYIFRKPVGSWVNMTETQKIVASDGAENDRFGYGVCISGDFILAGAYQDDDADDDGGAVYIMKQFQPIEITWHPSNWINYCPGVSGLSQNVSGKNISVYQWQVSTDGGNSFADVVEKYPGYGHFFTLPLTTDIEIDGNLYRCIVSNPGYIDTSNAAIIILDTVPPEITCPSDLTITANPDDFYIVGNTRLDATAEDYCGLVSLINDKNEDTTLVGATFGVGDHTITWTATDELGNVTTCTVNLTVNAYTNIEGLTASKVRVFPNPVKDKLTLQLDGFEDVMQVVITDITGSQLLLIDRNFDKLSEIDMSQLKSGIYLLKIQTQTGIYCKRVIKE
ncbi:MAG: T9SS type A sorting domain-containing protein [Bacteroidales bacterium]|nr:T9SS type A sorting domain-containing protein [Bacteroidales bacterium]